MLRVSCCRCRSPAPTTIAPTWILDLERGDFVIVATRQPRSHRRRLGRRQRRRRGGQAARRRRQARRAAAAGRARRFIDWVAQYTLAPPGAVLAMAMRVRRALEPPRVIAACRRSETAPLLSGLRLTAERQRVLDVLADGPARPTAGTGARGRRRRRRRRAGAGGRGRAGGDRAAASAAVRGAGSRHAPARRSAPRRQRARRQLSRSVGRRLRASRCSTASPARARPRSISRPIAERCATAGQALVLLPEIALTAQLLDRFTRALRRARRRSGIRDLTRRERRARLARGRRTARRASWSARARRCSCPSRSRPHRRRRGARRRPTSRRTASSTRPATWRWCARSSRQIPIVLVSATPSLETASTSPRGRYARCICRDRHGGAAAAAIIAADRSAADEPPRAAAGCRRRCAEALTETLATRRAGAAVPQPPRLCAADALPRLRPPPAMPATAPPGWSSIASAAGCNCHHCGFAAADPRRMPGLQGERTRWPPAARASSASPKRWRRCFPTARIGADDQRHRSPAG